MAPKKKVKSDITWDYCMSLGSLHFKCYYCPKKMYGGAFRMEHHLGETHEEVAPCEKLLVI